MNFLKIWLLMVSVVLSFNAYSMDESSNKIKTFLTNIDDQVFHEIDLDRYRSVEPIFFDFNSSNEEIEKLFDTIYQLSRKQNPLPPAQVLLAKIHLSGWNCIPNVKAGEDLLQMAAELGYRPANLLLAEYYRNKAFSPQPVVNKGKIYYYQLQPEKNNMQQLQLINQKKIELQSIDNNDISSANEEIKSMLSSLEEVEKSIDSDDEGLSSDETDTSTEEEDDDNFNIFKHNAKDAIKNIKTYKESVLKKILDEYLEAAIKHENIKNEIETIKEVFISYKYLFKNSPYLGYYLAKYQFCLAQKLECTKWLSKALEHLKKTDQLCRASRDDYMNIIESGVWQEIRENVSNFNESGIISFALAQIHIQRSGCNVYPFLIGENARERHIEEALKLLEEVRSNSFSKKNKVKEGELFNEYYSIAKYYSDKKMIEEELKILNKVLSINKMDCISRFCRDRLIVNFSDKLGDQISAENVLNDLQNLHRINKYNPATLFLAEYHTNEIDSSYLGEKNLKYGLDLMRNLANKHGQDESILKAGRYLGYWHYFGRNNCKKNYKKTIDYLSKHKEDDESQYYLATIYYNEKEYKKAFDIFNVDNKYKYFSNVYLAQMYLLGLGCEVDFNKAYHLLKNYIDEYCNRFKKCKKDEKDEIKNEFKRIEQIGLKDNLQSKSEINSNLNYLLGFYFFVKSEFFHEDLKDVQKDLKEALHCYLLSKSNQNLDKLQRFDSSLNLLYILFNKNYLNGKSVDIKLGNYIFAADIMSKLLDEYDIKNLPKDYIKHILVCLTFFKSINFTAYLENHKVDKVKLNKCENSIKLLLKKYEEKGYK